jgi:hypothetical protein
MFQPILMLGLMLISQPPSRASQTDQQGTMRIFFDPRVERATLKLAMGAALRTALQLRFNVRARVFDTSVADDWTPPLRMGLDDFHPSIAGIFHGGGDREREAEQAKRLAAALSSFDNYLKNIKADSGPCTHLLQITQEIANGQVRRIMNVLSHNKRSASACPFPTWRLFPSWALRRSRKLSRREALT